MNAVFLDTSGWLAALNPREAEHEASLAVYRACIEGRRRLVTTNLVLAEMQILVSRARSGAEALRFLDIVYSDPTHEVVHVTRALERAAIDRWLRRFADQRLSLCDATSFEVMREQRIRQVITRDAHFAMAGFEPLA